jgi:hypothetical protein
MKQREWKVGVKTLEYYKDHSELFEAEWKQALAENERLKALIDEAKPLIIGLKSLTAHHDLIDACREWLKKNEVSR